MLRIVYIISTFILLVASLANGQHKIEKEISYISDLAFNLKGGNKQGIAWLGRFQASLLFDTELLKIWKNGHLKFAYISTQGSSFSEMTGDMQVISNIEAQQLSTTLEFWYQHKLDKLAFTTGFIDLNAFFCFSDNALTLINSSFGIQPTISGNMPAPIYPITALGGVIEYKPVNSIDLQIGVFDGTPSLRQEFQFLPNTNWNKSEGMLFISEFSRRHQINNHEGVLKGGAWIHTQKMRSHHQGEYPLNYGFYIIGEQEIYGTNDKKMNIWAKFGSAPNDCNMVRFFNETGVSIINQAEKPFIDVVSLGIGQVILCPEFKKINELNHNETVMEFTAQKNFGILNIQPDFQYIFHPSGLKSIQNPFCFIFRTTLTI